MQKYYSGLHILEEDAKDGIFCKGRGWHIAFESDPSYHTIVGPNREPAKEIIVYADSIERAQYVVNLISAAYCLDEGELIADEANRVFGKRPETVSDIEEQLLAGGCRGFAAYYFPVACLIAAKASRKKAYQYAIFKFLLSLRAVPLGVRSLDPQGDWEPGTAVSACPDEHVFNAHAIISGYSVLEELSLELKASEKNPSKINGRWNPVVKHDLEDRLIKANVNLSEPLLWTLRDTPTMIERSRRPESISKCEWSQARVRDVYVEVIDAIAYASWLRSRTSAHKLPQLAKSLTIYDVANIQHLARRILLETLGFWRHFEQHTKSPHMV